MKYKDRRQRGPDQPVEFLEFRPTLVPSILVNKLWADEGTSVLWRRYPHLVALKDMGVERKQWYARKVESAFIMSPPDSIEDLTYLEGLDWPCLRTLELEVDWRRHGTSLTRVLHDRLEYLELSGAQSGGSEYVAHVVFPAFLVPCSNLKSIHIGPDFIDPRDPLDSQTLCDLLASRPSIKDVQIMNARFASNDTLFQFLCKHQGHETLEIDLEPGLSLLPFFFQTNKLFSSLQRLHIMCYPEIALAMPLHVASITDLSIDIARIPDRQAQDGDIIVLDDLLAALTQCKHLQLLKVNVGQLAVGFPSANALPTLSGQSLAKLVKGCSQLKDINLLASEPASIDGSKISIADFEDFCKGAPNLTNLSLKFHPGTTVSLEESALQSLGKHCQHLEVLRLKITIQLPLLTASNALSPPLVLNDCIPDATQFRNDKKSHETQAPPDSRKHVDIEPFATQATTSTKPLLPNLTHLALARPQSVLSIASEPYAASMISQSSAEIDPTLEQDLVRCWAHSLLVHFPHLEILEAWGDWTGHDNDSLNYFLPLQEPLASTWEFLSGVEQDLWEDGEDVDKVGLAGLADDFDERISFDSRGSGDWDRASLMNEFPEDDEYESEYLNTYDEEPEDMPTPIDGRHAWAEHTEEKLAAVRADYDEGIQNLGVV